MVSPTLLQYILLAEELPETHKRLMLLLLQHRLDLRVGNLRIFTPTVLLFLSRSELECMWAGEPQDSPEAQGS